MAKTTDYGYCEDCEEFFDLWKYDSIEDTGHADHNWRHVTKEELAGCIEDCKTDGCFEEEILGVTNPTPEVEK